MLWASSVLCYPWQFNPSTKHSILPRAQGPSSHVNWALFWTPYCYKAEYYSFDKQETLNFMSSHGVMTLAKYIGSAIFFHL